ncbi:SHOCT domain-containing protein [Aeromicrobium sp.]|uniref:SHOCT domain-containing protein n=1 Tax=Aeromicrobium sp. TaxID=1871063 RepID=UPI003D6B0C0C
MNTTLITELAAHDQYGPGGWWPIFPIFWLLAFIAVLLFFATMSRRRRHGHSGSQSGHARLAERFAAGEIDEDEYRTRRAVLNEKDRR